MSQYKCDDCNDTGLLQTESLSLGRPFMEGSVLVYPVTCHGDWEETQCHCVGEND